MSLIQQLEWRYATKKMSGEKIPADKLQNILRATQLSASSYGLQPYTILVIEDAATKEKLAPAAYNQPQIAASSQLLVFCAWTDITEKEIAAFIDNIAKTRNMDAEHLAGYKSMMEGSITKLTVEQKQIWASKQIYIALGTALVAAASEEVDATPMEGFNAQQFDEILGLAAKGLKSVVILPLGYRAADDQLASAIKVRRDQSELFQFI
ncbi:nitroreductase family protein [Parasediminibacterium paludis]|uniref:Nitroreductase family protein n=1 Tax=Parasediminibacterium paludis TaxID=908966 RepID=A0ABV8PY85_9BACT